MNYAVTDDKNKLIVYARSYYKGDTWRIDFGKGKHEHPQFPRVSGVYALLTLTVFSLVSFLTEPNPLLLVVYNKVFWTWVINIIFT